MGLQSLTKVYGEGIGYWVLGIIPFENLKDIPLPSVNGELSVGFLKFDFSKSQLTVGS